MSNIYELSLNPEYCSHWGLQEALRELLQNMLDSDKENILRVVGDKLTIGNKDTTIPPNTLLLGVSSKQNDTTSVGCFGEGFKVALLILTRMGYDVTVKNGDYTWSPYIEESLLYECEVLKIEEIISSHHNSDLEFVIEGLSEEDIKELVDRCLYLQPPRDETQVGTCEMGRVFFDMKGKLYVGGLYVKDTELDFSYDFNPEYLKLNRDRQSVDGWDLGVATTKLLASLKDGTDFLECVEGKSPDVHYAQYYSGCLSDDLKDKCFTKFSSDPETQGKVIAASEDEKRRLVNEGYSPKSIHIESNDVKRVLIKNSPKYKEFLSDVGVSLEEPKSPYQMLVDFQEECLRYTVEDSIVDEFDRLLDVLGERGIEWQE